MPRRANGHLQPFCEWSGSQTRAVGGRDHRTPPPGGFRPFFKGGVSQGVSTQTYMCLLAWDFARQGGDSAILGEIPWLFHLQSLQYQYNDQAFNHAFSTAFNFELLAFSFELATIVFKL